MASGLIHLLRLSETRYLDSTPQKLIDSDLWSHVVQGVDRLIFELKRAAQHEIAAHLQSKLEMVDSAFGDDQMEQTGVHGNPKYRRWRAITGLRAVVEGIGALAKRTPEFLDELALDSTWLGEPDDSGIEQHDKKMSHWITPGTNGKDHDDVDGEADVPPLTEHEIAVITTLAGFDPSRLASGEAIRKAMPGPIRRSRRTIQPIVTRLIELGLAERPRGARSGVRLTLAGRRLAPKIAR